MPSEPSKATCDMLPEPPANVRVPSRVWRTGLDHLGATVDPVVPQVRRSSAAFSGSGSNAVTQSARIRLRVASVKKPRLPPMSTSRSSRSALFERRHDGIGKAVVGAAEDLVERPRVAGPGRRAVLVMAQRHPQVGIAYVVAADGAARGWPHAR